MPRRPRRPPAWALAGLMLGALAVAWLALSLFQPFKGEGEGNVRVSIPIGASVGDIADLLAEHDVVSSAFFFELRTTLGGRRGDLKPGSYGLRREMSHSAVLDALTAGPRAEVVSLTIPEGRSRREIAPLATGVGLRGSYMRASVRSRSLSPRRYGAGRARDLEGFLFPATYELEAGASARSLVEKQLEAFRREFGKLSLRFARSKNLTPYDVLTIASMVEREASLERERPLVASVIYNRLRDGTPLGIDATIRFATSNWTSPLRQSELAIDSPYNTRRRAGLPPGPIGNPGVASLRAAARPATSSYRFYVVKPGSCGEHSFSRTLAQFERDRVRYQAERARRGGRSPTSC